MQPSLIKYEAVLITDNDDLEIIFSTVSFHLYLSGAELYINMQLIEDAGDIYNQDKSCIGASNPHSPLYGGGCGTK